jgi:hypothetical protein
MFCAVAELSGDRLAAAGGLLTDRIGIGVLTRMVPRDLVAEVLAETGRREAVPPVAHARGGVLRDGHGDLPGWL